MRSCARVRCSDGWDGDLEDALQRRVEAALDLDPVVRGPLDLDEQVPHAAARRRTELGQFEEALGEQAERRVLRDGSVGRRECERTSGAMAHALSPSKELSVPSSSHPTADESDEGRGHQRVGPRVRHRQQQLRIAFDLLGRGPCRCRRVLDRLRFDGHRVECRCQPAPVGILVHEPAAAFTERGGERRAIVRRRAGGEPGQRCPVPGIQSAALSRAGGEPVADRRARPGGREIRPASVGRPAVPAEAAASAPRWDRPTASPTGPRCDRPGPQPGERQPDRALDARRRRRYPDQLPSPTAAARPAAADDPCRAVPW